VAGALGVVVACGWSVPDGYAGALILLAGVGFVLLLAERLTGSANPVLTGWVIVACGLVLFGVELADLLLPGGGAAPTEIAGRRRPALVEWGEESTFATFFPREEPFIGPGGRLRPGLDVRMRAPGYPDGARLVTNSIGLRNAEELAGPPAPGELRVLSLGDSFSTGYCVDQESFFGARLESVLGELLPERRVRVLNAEVSDPAYGLRYLQQHGMATRPHLVVYGLSGNDIMQAEQFHGADRLFRLDHDGRLVANPEFDPTVESAWVRYRDLAYPRPGAAAEAGTSLRAEMRRRLLRFRLLRGLAEAVSIPGDPPPRVMHSYAEEYERVDGRKRLVDGSANLGFFYVTETEPIELMYGAFFELIVAMRRSAEEGGAQFLLFLHPYRYQVQPEDWEVLRRRWSLDEVDFDLRLQNRRLAEHGRREGVRVCDPVEAFAAQPGQLYLPGGDTHYNRDGHRIAAEAAARCITEILTP
jgi:hypothetical protein